jgi:hypothetical protein
MAFTCGPTICETNLANNKERLAVAAENGMPVSRVRMENGGIDDCPLNIKGVGCRRVDGSVRTAPYSAQTFDLDK